jgi:hypothetical protein
MRDIGRSGGIGLIRLYKKKETEHTSVREEIIHRVAIHLRNPIRREELTVAATVGTVLLVVIAVSLAAVVGGFMFGLVKLDEPSPEIEIVMSSDADRWNIHVSKVSEPVPISQFRLLSHNKNGTFTMYDSDGDAVPDAVMVMDLDDLVVKSASGPQRTPIVYVDADGNGKVTTGDFLKLFQPFFPLVGPLVDATHGFRVVGTAPMGIPKDSTMVIYISTETLTGGEVRPGDYVTVVLKKAGVEIYSIDGYADARGMFAASTEISDDFIPASYSDHTITIRPGEADEWSVNFPFKVLPSDPPTAAMRDYYYIVTHPLDSGGSLTLVHKPSNSVVLQQSL